MSPQQEEPSSERSPLLGQQNGSTTGHTIDPEGQSNTDTQPDGSDQVVLVEEPSTKKLIAMMGAAFIGVFFAALGKL